MADADDIIEQAVNEEIVNLQNEITDLEQAIRITLNGISEYRSKPLKNAINEELKELYHKLKTAKDLLQTLTRH